MDAAYLSEMAKEINKAAIMREINEMYELAQILSERCLKLKAKLGNDHQTKTKKPGLSEVEVAQVIAKFRYRRGLGKGSTK